MAKVLRIGTKEMQQHMPPFKTLPTVCINTARAAKLSRSGQYRAPSVQLQVSLARQPVPSKRPRAFDLSWLIKVRAEQDHCKRRTLS